MILNKGCQLNWYQTIDYNQTIFKETGSVTNEMVILSSFCPSSCIVYAWGSVLSGSIQQLSLSYLQSPRAFANIFKIFREHNNKLQELFEEALSI